VIDGPVQVPRYDLTVVEDELSLDVVGDVPRNFSRPKQPAVVTATMRMSAVRRNFIAVISDLRPSDDSQITNSDYV
jgi:hypothetical protein